MLRRERRRKRMFLAHLAARMLAYEGNSHLEWFEGNLRDHQQDSVNQHKVTYKKLTR